MTGKAETLEEFLARGGSIKKIEPKQPEPGAAEPTVWGKGMSRRISAVASQNALDALRAAPIADTGRNKAG